MKASAIGKEIRAELSRTLSSVRVAACEAVVAATPVDCGLAADNWILAVGSPHRGVIGAHEATSPSAQDAGISRIEKYDVGKDGKIFLTNDVDYMQHLDQGSSPQAPAGFVADAFASAIRSAPQGKKTAVRQMLKGMAKHAYRKGY